MEYNWEIKLEIYSYNKRIVYTLYMFLGRKGDICFNPIPLFTATFVSLAPEFTSGLEWGSCYSIFSFICMLSFCTFSFGHCVVCSSSIYGFWLPLWYLQTLLTTIWIQSIQLYQQELLLCQNSRHTRQVIEWVIVV